MTDRAHGDEYRREWAMEILKLLVERRGYLNEVLKITNELNESMDRNDRVSVQMLLKMRAEELEKIDLTLGKYHAFKEQLGEETGKAIDSLTEGNKLPGQTAEMDKIIEVSGNCRKILDDIIAVDMRMSRRIAGKDSFYEK